MNFHHRWWGEALVQEDGSIKFSVSNLQRDLALKTSCIWGTKRGIFLDLVVPDFDFEIFEASQRNFARFSRFLGSLSLPSTVSRFFIFFRNFFFAMHLVKVIHGQEQTPSDAAVTTAPTAAATGAPTTAPAAIALTAAAATTAAPAAAPAAAGTATTAIPLASKVKAQKVVQMTKMSDEKTKDDGNHEGEEADGDEDAGDEETEGEASKGEVKAEVPKAWSRKWPTHSRFHSSKTLPSTKISAMFGSERIFPRKSCSKVNSYTKQPNNQTGENNKTTRENPPAKISRQASGVHTWSLATGGVSQAPNMGSCFFKLIFNMESCWVL